MSKPVGIELVTLIADAVLAKKALDVVCLDVRHFVDYTDYLVICSGNSDRQVQAIAESVRGRLHDVGLRPMGTEGESTGQWILMDCGDVVVHVFYSQIRHVFQLERLWADAPEIPVEESVSQVAAAKL